MRAQIVRPAQMDEKRRPGVAVVIDVLRATSTAIVIAARAPTPMLVLDVPEDLLRFARPRTKYLIFSEIKGASAYADRVDNSPSVARGVDFAGRVPVLVSTNGTPAIRSAIRGYDEVVLASFMNLSAVVEYLRQSAHRSAAIIPSGDFKRSLPHQEDDECAELLVQRLLDRKPDPQRASDPAQPRQPSWDSEVEFEELDVVARQRRGLPMYHSGYTEDFDISFCEDLYRVVPVAGLADPSDPKGPIYVEAREPNALP